MKQSTTTRMESNELDCVKSMMKSMKIKNHSETRPIMAKKIHEGNDEDSLHQQ
jgi:hypothetical protein